jgi:hypothetical protein
MVGIGTSTPLGVFSVHATQGGQTPLFVVASSTSGAATTTAFYIAPNGTIGVSTAPVSGYQMTVSGALRSTQLYGISQIRAPNYLMINPGTVNSYASITGGMYASNSGGTYPFNATMNLIISPQSGAGTARDIVFAVGSTTVSTMVIQGSTYNVGIGTTSPFARLSVYGNSVATTTFALYGYSSQTANIMYVATTTGSATSTAFVIDSMGEVGIATSSPWRTLSVNGTIAAPSLTVAGASGSAVCIAAGGEMQVNSGAQTCTVSSARFKHDIESQVSGLDTIRALRPVSFKYNNDASEQVRLGLIAEEVKDVDPRLIFKGEDNLPRGVRYEDLTSVLTKAVQELDNEVKTNSSTTKEILDSSNSNKSDLEIRFVQNDNEFRLIHDTINNMNIRLDSLDATSTASTTADLLIKNDGFLTRIFEKFKEYMSKASDWVVNKITAVTGIFDRVETTTAVSMPYLKNILTKKRRKKSGSF